MHAIIAQKVKLQMMMGYGIVISATTICVPNGVNDICFSQFFISQKDLSVLVFTTDSNYKFNKANMKNDKYNLKITLFSNSSLLLSVLVRCFVDLPVQLVWVRSSTIFLCLFSSIFQHGRPFESSCFSEAPYLNFTTCQ